MSRVLLISGVTLAGMVGCETMNRPVTSGGFDPLRTPGSGSQLNLTTNTGFTPGQFVKAAMNNTAFFLKRPKGEAEADKLLTKGSSMKVISVSDSYVKVELDGSDGAVGWVPAVQLEDPNAAADMTAPFSTTPGEVQVYPPLDGTGAPLPLPDPKGLPPDGAIPTVIDPEAPATGGAAPKVNNPTESFEAPAAGTPVTPAAVPPKKAPAPLPPNGEELEAAKKAGKQ